MSEIDRIIEEEYTPYIIGKVYPKIENELTNWTKDDFIEFFTQFERMVKMKREQLMMLETKHNLN